MGHLYLAAAFFALVSSASAQGVILNPFLMPLPNLRTYLQLTDAQAQKLLSNNDEYNRWSAQKQSRILQVQREIVEQTAAEPLDPAALGIRYAEIEAICREMRDKAATYQRQNIDLLTDAQKAKLKALDDAMKLAPVIAEAQQGNLLGSAGSTPSSFAGASSLSGFITASLIGGLSYTNGCTLPFAQALATRTGDFSFTPGSPAP